MADQLQLQIGADTSNLQQGLTRAEKAVKSFDATAKRSAASSGQAGQSLVNLGRIASDLPFGFIAIQNNLDPLIQSFGSLSKSSGGVGGALKALGGALIGPAGLALAFSTVTAGVTIAIQKYGSLGAAIDALFGREDKLVTTINEQVKAYEKLSSSIGTTAQLRRDAENSAAGEAVRVNTLIGILQNETATRNEKATALNTLRTVSKAYFGDLKEEDLLTQKVTDRVNAYIESLIKAAQVKELTDAFLKQSKALDEINEAARLATAALPNLNAAVDRSTAAQQRFGSAYQQSVTPLTNAAAAVERFNEINSKQFEATRRFKELKQALADALVQQNTVNSSVGVASSALTTNSTLVRSNEKEQAKLAATLAKQREEWDKLQAALKRLARPTESDTGITEQFQRENPLQPPAQQGPFTNLGLIQGRIAIEEADAKTAAFQERIKGLVSDFNDFLAPAISTVFGAIENGQSVFKAVGQSLKALIVQLAATVAKAAILAIIISKIPGAGAILNIAGSAAGGTGNFGGIFKNFLPSLFGGGGGLRRAAAPTFSGGGVTPSGFQLAGQVVFVQRGPDLVGVLNQGNARIGRVG